MIIFDYASGKHIVIIVPLLFCKLFCRVLKTWYKIHIHLCERLHFLLNSVQKKRPKKMLTLLV